MIIDECPARVFYSPTMPHGADAGQSRESLRPHEKSRALARDFCTTATALGTFTVSEFDVEAAAHCRQLVVVDEVDRYADVNATARQCLGYVCRPQIDIQSFQANGDIGQDRMLDAAASRIAGLHLVHEDDG